ncbi:MAG: DUF2628 domain-containing protein, partial [Deferribacteraceae bacterium]|nr:DUF2628 domain-containing protein [Deferribacteraceae bacterium]
MKKRTDVILKLREDRSALEKLLTEYVQTSWSINRFINLFNAFTVQGDIVLFSHKGIFAGSPLQRLSINIGAFLLGPFYFFYRKLYLFGILFLIASSFIAYISIKTGFKSIYLLNLAITLVVFIHVNAVYLRKFCDNLVKSGYGKVDEQYVLGYMKASGGVHNWALLGGVVYLITFVAMLVMIFS